MLILLTCNNKPVSAAVSDGALIATSMSKLPLSFLLAFTPLLSVSQESVLQQQQHFQSFLPSCPLPSLPHQSTTVNFFLALLLQTHQPTKTSLKTKKMNIISALLLLPIATTTHY